MRPEYTARSCPPGQRLTSGGICKPDRGTDAEGRPVSVRIEDDHGRIAPPIRSTSKQPAAENGTFDVISWISSQVTPTDSREDCWGICEMLSNDHCVSDVWNGFATCSCNCCYAYYSWSNNVMEYTFNSWIDANGQVQVGVLAGVEGIEFNTFNQTICQCGACHYAYNECVNWCVGHGRGGHNVGAGPGQYRQGGRTRKMPTGGPVTGNPQDPGALNYTKQQMESLLNEPTSEEETIRTLRGVRNNLDRHLRGQGMDFGHNQEFKKGGRLPKRRRKK
tara:strand:+ start:33 stop:863 length:831 start_codon:yes stop_codon:yes gene_type:complete